MTLSAVAQVQLREDEVTAVIFAQGETTDWYMLSTKPKVTFDKDFNPVINNTTTYDLALGKVRTYFGVPGINTALPTLPYEGKVRKGSVKVIENGQFRIIREGKAYMIMGVEE